MQSPLELNKLGLLLANVNGSRPSQDLALKYAEVQGVHIVCLTEPHLLQGAISSTPGWKAVATAHSAILINILTRII